MKLQCSLMLVLVALIAGASAARTLKKDDGPPLEVLELLPPQAQPGGPAADSGFTPGTAKKVSSVGKS